MNVGSAILPVNNSSAQFGHDVFQIMERRRLDGEQKKRQDEQRQNALTQYIGNEFKLDDFTTGTAIDPLVIKQLTESKQKLADIIKRNPSIGSAELMMMAQNDAGRIAKYSALAKNLSASIKESVKGIDDKGLDTKALQQLALQKAFMKKDAQGNWVVKDPSEIEQAAQEDHISNILNDHPELVTRDNTGLVETLKGIKTNTVGDKTNLGYTADIHPFDEIIKDNKGVPTGIRTKQETVKIGNSQVSILADDAYQMLFNTYSSRGYLNKELKRQYPNIDPRTPEAEIIRRKIALDIVDQNVQGRKFVNETSFGDRNDEWSRRNAIKINISDSRQSEKDETKKEKLKNSPVGILVRGLAGDQSITGALQGGELNQITGGLVLEDGRDKKDSPYKIVTQSIKKNGDGIVVIDNKGVVKEYDRSEVVPFLKRIGKLNGLSPDEVQDLVDQHYTASGKPKQSVAPTANKPAPKAPLKKLSGLFGGK